MDRADPPNRAINSAVRAFTIVETIQELDSATFTELSTKIDVSDSTLYDSDRVHPSVKGSSVMADLLADAIANAR